MARTNDDWSDKYGSEFQRPAVAYIDDDGTKVYENEIMEDNTEELTVEVLKDETE